MDGWMEGRREEEICEVIELLSLVCLYQKVELLKILEQ